MPSIEDRILTAQGCVLSLPPVRGVSLRLMLAALVAGAAGVAGASAPCPEATGAVGLQPVERCGGDRADGLCAALRRSSCRDLAALATADACGDPIVACVEPTQPAPPRTAAAIAIEPPAPRGPAAIAVIPFAPKTSPPVA